MNPPELPEWRFNCAGDIVIFEMVVDTSGNLIVQSRVIPCER